jgi:hypothetical protein
MMWIRMVNVKVRGLDNVDMGGIIMLSKPRDLE